ncbi:hypothetical protein BKA93DRAFT_195569 [Sparassis latifolia]
MSDQLGILLIQLPSEFENFGVALLDEMVLPVDGLTSEVERVVQATDLLVTLLDELVLLVEALAREVERFVQVSDERVLGRELLLCVCGRAVSRGKIGRERRDPGVRLDNSAFSVGDVLTSPCELVSDIQDRSSLVLDACPQPDKCCLRNHYCCEPRYSRELWRQVFRSICKEHVDQQRNGRDQVD